MPNLPKDIPKPAMEDVNSYHPLMRSAGYSVENGTLRAQMVRGSQALDAIHANDAKRELMGFKEKQSKQPNIPLQQDRQHPRMSLYHFDKGKTASTRMKCMWPNLSPVINESLAKLTEFVLRDYVSSWYSKVDEHVVFDDPQPPSTNMTPADSTSNLSHSNHGGNRPSTAPSESERSRTISNPSEVNSLINDSFQKEDSLHSFSEGGDALFQQRPHTSTLSSRSSLSSKDQHHPLTPSPYSASSPTQQQKRMQQQQRTMVLTTTGTQPAPFIDSLYSCFAYLLGMLATRASENVNVLELLLLHLPHILTQNLRVYREMKNIALEKKRRRVAAEREKLTKRGMEENDEVNDTRKSQLSPSSLQTSGSFAASSSQQEGEVSEIAIVREYLLAGRFHRAVTFGLDVPSLLFADPLAKDCPPGPSYKGNSDCDRLNGHPDEDAILYDRLLSPESSLIDECELDYGRVLASKLTKMSVPKNEVDSSIVRTMLVEMLASCVLGPVMGCFSPDSVNGWIITGLGLLEKEGTEVAANSTPDPSNTGDAVSASINSDLGTNHSVTDDPNRNFSTSVVSEGDDLLDNIVDSVMEEIASEGSVASEMEDSLFDIDDQSTRKKEMLELDNCSKAEKIITMLSMSIIELGSFVDFEDCRYAREHGQDCSIDWDSHKCRESVRHLVLVIEAALLFGVRSHPKRQHSPEDRTFSEFEIEATLNQPDGDEFEVDIDEGLVEPKVMSSVYHQHSSLSVALMELTGDIDAFEKLVVDAEQVGDDDSLEDDSEVEIVIPMPNELSTLRTLIAAWLHTGQAYKVLSIVVRAKQTILRRFYHSSAFLRRDNYASDFTRLLRQLDGVDILVDTMAVLASQCLLVGNGFDVLMKRIQRQPKTQFHQELADPFPEISGRRKPQPHSYVNSMSVVGSVKANLVQNRNRIARFAQSATEIDLNPWKDKNTVPTRRSAGANIAYNHHQNTHTTPAYLEFSKNDVFASSLRSERERRNASWSKEMKDKKKLDFVSRTKGVKDKDVMMHRELHHLSRFFYSNTNEVRIEPCQSLSDSAANVTVKAVGTRKKIEVPDEDSSFLLRAQPRPLKPVAIQRDQRNPNVACKIYVAMYEEPAIHPKTKRFYGGRYLRQCLMRYYPNDKTASVTVAAQISVLDGRTQEGNNQFVLTEEFQKIRHTCLKVATGGILSSPLMEASDFCSTPRTGRAIDFVHRVSLFHRPMVELGGKKFVVHDASSHRADASSLELSDASMTAALILRGSSGLNFCDISPGSFNIKVSDEGTPLVLLRSNRDGSPGGSPTTKDEARPYRPSFIRAALLVKSAKQEAQSQCLHYCIRSGSARSSNKVKSDEWLQPTLNLLQYANSRRQEEQSTLLRDLRFGINHIDMGQLRRNGLLNPRYPTILRGLNTKIEGVVEVKAASDFDLLGIPLILFKIRCTAIAEYIGDEDDDEFPASCIDDSIENKKSKGTKSRYFREEWTVLRSHRDFTVFHKHLKAQVAPTEHSASAGAKLVGSVSAALTIVGGNAAANERQRGPLVPSLSHATKAGTLGLSTKKVLEKRKKLLDQYLKYLVSPNNLLSRCPELLKFLGAYTPVFSLQGSDKAVDEYGREDIVRVELVTEKLKAGIVQVKQGTEQVSAPDIITTKLVEETMAVVAPSKAEYMDDSVTVSTLGATTVTEEESKPTERKQNHAVRRMARIRAGEIRLKDVRRSIFRLLKHLFNLDNASFFRSRVISVLKTMSVAVASVQDFHLLLFQTHVDYMNGEWISGWIFYLVDMFWPNGVFYKKGSPMTEEEIFDLKRNSKKMLEKMFPDQLRTVLGKHTDEGLDMLHEMLQNRLVLKSMAYMIMDFVWVELFPEMSDFVTGAECLEKEA
eukprot:CAMPEP_0172330712 /NCGR_PEP_ID=MMETSP1058-20130122/61546_1 /TAXON_ID=83371 /ORGANISM="Detonula confervacea, Strain CCMP 353" /LENGTH=1862 /DNA_ID=CAMNT_0013047939 /DNA_START=683 /DNA_END=6271 /DNA_ORIENTATION=-